MKFIIMAAVHILNFGEMAGFKIVPFIASHVKKKKKKNSWNYEKKKKKKHSWNYGKKKKKNQPIRTRQFCMKTTDIKLFVFVYGHKACFSLPECNEM